MWQEYGDNEGYQQVIKAYYGQVRCHKWKVMCIKYYNVRCQDTIKPKVNLQL